MGLKLFNLITIVSFALLFIPAKLTPLFRGKLTPCKGPVSSRVKELE